MVRRPRLVDSVIGPLVCRLPGSELASTVGSSVSLKLAVVGGTMEGSRPSPDRASAI